MQQIATFEKVSLDQYIKDRLGYDGVDENVLKTVVEEWNNIKLPTRATDGSAGYDFYSPTFGFIGNDSKELLPTGIRVKIDPGWVLMLFPRSGFGFKYGFKLANTVGIIDSDYYNAKNEGHIMVKVSAEDYILALNTGDRFVQGIFVPFGIATNDVAVQKDRVGGFGSTGSR